MSRSNDSLLMWSHYGDSHKGYVLGLDESHQWFRQINGLGISTKPHSVVYTSRRSLVIPGREGSYEQLLCFKSLEWAYEEEVRIFQTFGTSHDEFELNTPDGVHLFDLPKECIREVFIGANAGSELRERIHEAISRNGMDVKVFDAYIDNERYALKFRPAV